MFEERFSKKTLALHLYRRWVSIANRHCFSIQNGSQQVEGKKPETLIAYGQWVAIKHLMEELDIVDLIPKDEPGITVLHAGHPRLVRD